MAKAVVESHDRVLQAQMVKKEAFSMNKGPSQDDVELVILP